MTTKEILKEAFLRGHAWNPAYPNLQNVDMGRVLMMDGSERDAKDMMASRQAIDINMWGLVAAFHAGRQPSLDGDIGPATRALVEQVPRCPIPDYAPPPGASFHYDDPELQKAVESQQRAAANQLVGRYWRECDPERKGIHSLVIGLDIRRAPPNWLANQDKILEARRACAAEIGVSVRFVINPQSMTGLQQYQVFGPIAGSVIGFNYFPDADSCGKIPDGKLDTGYDPSDWRLHANLGTHESEGHGFGFNHTRGGIMNPSIVLVWPLSYVNDTSWSVARSYYGGSPIPTGPTDPTPPGPTDPTPDPWRGSSVTVSLPGRPPRRFIPAIEV